MPEALNTSVLRGPGSATVAGRVNVDGRTANTLKGLESFSQGLKDLGDFEKARKVNNDIITAKVAFSANKAMPGGLEPEAESFYNQAMAVTGTRKFLADFADREKVITGNVLGSGDLVNISESGEELTFTGAYENQLELEFNAFKAGAGFNDAQNSDVTQILNEAMFQYKANFATAHAAQMKSERDANNKQFVNEEIRASLNIMREANIDNLSSNQVFTHSYHQGLFDRLSIMAPWMTRDEKDLMIIEGFADIASDNSNPDADMMDYLSEPRPDGQPRFSDIPTLRKAVLAGQTAAISKFNTVHSAEIAAEKYQEELRQTDLRERFNNRLMKNLNGPPGERLSLKTWLTAMQEAGVESKTQNFIKGLYDAALSEARTDPESQAAIAGLKDAVDNMEFKKEDDLVRDPRFKDLAKEDQVALRKLFVDNAAGKVSKQLTANQATLKEQYQVYLKSILEINGENYTIRTDDLGTPINVSSTYLMAANFIRDKLSNKLREGYELAKKEDRLLDWEATIKPKILSDVMEHYLGDKLRAIGVKGMMGGGRHLPDPEQNKLDQEAYRPPMPLVSVGKSAPTNTLSSHTVASQNPQNLPGRWTDVNNGERVALHHIKEIQDALNKYPEGSLGEFTSLADIALIRILKKAGSGIATFGQNIVNSFTSDSPIDPETEEFGNRLDGTKKGKGFLGILPRPDGGVSTELSVGVNIDGKETLIPTLVPGLTKEEVDFLLNLEPGDARSIPDSIINKAVKHAKDRMNQGKSPFLEPTKLVGKGKWKAPLTPYEQERIDVANYKKGQNNAVDDGTLTLSKVAPVAIAANAKVNKQKQINAANAKVNKQKQINAANAKVADAKEGGLVKSLTASDLPPGVMNAKSPKDVTEAGKVELVNFYKAMTDIVWPDNPLMSKVAIAQAIQESGWHVSELARKDNNLVGIKAGRTAPGTKGSVIRSTKEESEDGVSTIEAKFSANNSFLESFIQHRALLERKYASALKKTTFLKIAKELKRIGYATDKDYAKALDGIAITRRIKKDK
jgi:flagellum-specific peptidoglycan hydrolase FlgJ